MSIPLYLSKSSNANQDLEINILFKKKSNEKVISELLKKVKKKEIKKVKSSKKKIRDENKEPVIPLPVIASHDVTLQLKAHLKEYISDIEAQTGRAIPQKQIKLLEKYIEVTSIQKLSKEENRANRIDFNQKRLQLRKLWEMETGQNWPIYEKDVIVRGKILRRKGQSYDAHHIIENSYGGPARWWNIHPAAFPSEHQDGIHRDEGICSKIFGSLPPEYHHNIQKPKGIQQIKYALYLRI